MGLTALRRRCLPTKAQLRPVEKQQFPKNRYHGVGRCALTSTAGATMLTIIRAARLGNVPSLYPSVGKCAEIPAAEFTTSITTLDRQFPFLNSTNIILFIVIYFD